MPRPSRRDPHAAGDRYPAPIAWRPGAPKGREPPPSRHPESREAPGCQSHHAATRNARRPGRPLPLRGDPARSRRPASATAIACDHPTPQSDRQTAAIAPRTGTSGDDLHPTTHRATQKAARPTGARASTSRPGTPKATVMPRPSRGDHPTPQSDQQAAAIAPRTGTSGDDRHPTTHRAVTGEPRGDRHAAAIASTQHAATGNRYRATRRAKATISHGHRHPESRKATVCQSQHVATRRGANRAPHSQSRRGPARNEATGIPRPSHHPEQTTGVSHSLRMATTPRRKATGKLQPSRPGPAHREPTAIPRSIAP